MRIQFWKPSCLQSVIVQSRYRFPDLYNHVQWSVMIFHSTWWTQIRKTGSSRYHNYPTWWTPEGRVEISTPTILTQPISSTYVRNSKLKWRMNSCLLIPAATLCSPLPKPPAKVLLSIFPPCGFNQCVYLPPPFPSYNCRQKQLPKRTTKESQPKWWFPYFLWHPQPRQQNRWEQLQQLLASLECRAKTMKIVKGLPRCNNLVAAFTAAIKEMVFKKDLLFTFF